MNAANLKTDLGLRLGKYILISGIIAAIVIVVLISTGLLTWKDLMEMHFKLIEVCPFCM